MNCRNCGAKIEEDAGFCGNCGIAQNEDDTVGTGRVGPVGFSEAIQLGFQRWSDFRGRSTRAEYWWFTLFNFLATAVAIVIDLIVGTSFGASGGILQLIVQLVLIIPSLAVGARRLHDINRTGWWQLGFLGFVLVVIPGLVAWILLWYWAAQPSDQGSNRFGPRP